jgi:hypothetical protein
MIGYVLRRGDIFYMYCQCIKNVSEMYHDCNLSMDFHVLWVYWKLCPTPLFAPQCVLEMYLICLFQCIGHVLTIQYIPIHHRGTGMYCKTYCGVFTDVRDVFGEVFGFMSRRGIHLNTSVNTSQYIVEYIIIPLKYIPIHL